MKNAQLSRKAKLSVPVQGRSNFTGISSPRQWRAIRELLTRDSRSLQRLELDLVAGCSNGPALVAELRAKGLELPCHRIDFIDRDGSQCRPGVYSLTKADERKVRRWIARCLKGDGHGV
jgi:hypothetical protein